MPSNNAERIRELNEQYEDALFRLVMNDAAEKEGRLFFEENERLKNDPENLPSQKKIDKFTRLVDSRLKTAGKKQRNHRASKIFTRAAAALLALVVMFSAMMLTVQAFRIQVLNFLISIEPKFTSFQLKDNSDNQNNGQLIVNWTNAYVPTYIPKGYTVSSISYSDSAKKIIFTKQEDDSTIVYTEYNSINIIAVDTENASLVEKVKINGQEGTLSVKDSMTSVVWIKDNHLFTIQGQVSTNEAIKMAEGVKFIK